MVIEGRMLGKRSLARPTSRMQDTLIIITGDRVFHLPTPSDESPSEMIFLTVVACEIGRNSYFAGTDQRTGQQDWWLSWLSIGLLRGRL